MQVMVVKVFEKMIEELMKYNTSLNAQEMRSRKLREEKVTGE